MNKALRIINKFIIIQGFCTDKPAAVIILWLVLSVNLFPIADSTTTENYLTGFDVFNGNIDTSRISQSCVSCHNLVKVDSFNWNPSAKQIAIAAIAMDFADFEECILDPFGSDRLMEAHDGFRLTEAELKSLIIFFDEVAGYQLQPGSITKNSKANLLWVLLVLFLIVFVDYLVFQKIKKQYLHISVMSAILLFALILASNDLELLGLQFGYEPDQPIKFSHKIHSGENKIDCRYCHSAAYHANEAGIPGQNVCMNCHNMIQEGANSGEREIIKIQHALDAGKPIQWIRVTNLPDHATFNHAVHVSVSNLECTECHGDVENMNRIKVSTKMTMSWCLDCHKERSVNKENSYYLEVFDKLKIQNKIIADSVLVSEIGGIDCTKCHR